ncbi:MAG TPA: transcriptional regulator, partial [Clostridiales bacterium UBA8153]|nr:transcriptional regulator [Clostridiales bacterium UBA8153]
MPDYTVGVDLGGTKLLVAQVHPDGQLGSTSSYRTAVEDGPEGVLAQVARVVSREFEEGPPVAVGIGVPGLVDTITGECTFSPNLHWQQVPVARLLGSVLGVPVYVDNDVNLAALAEHRLGAGQGYRDLIMVTIGTGIGAGLILDGKLYRGSGGSAGELGHLPVDPQGAQCTCGRRGCLETTCSGTAIGRRATQLAHPASLLWGKPPPDARAVFAAARQGDELAREVVREAVDWLG